jgi:hypothetical protein
LAPPAYVNGSAAWFQRLSKGRKNFWKIFLIFNFLTRRGEILA